MARFRLARLVGVTLLLLAASAQAQQSHQHAMPTPPVTDAPSTRAFKQANETMHRAMAMHYTGDVDIDFVRNMIPHHEGAIAMAKILLEQGGKDPELRKMASEIIVAQEREIAGMKAWLAEHAK
jgi:uncharacterized protein (DUF305 family)